MLKVLKVMGTALLVFVMGVTPYLIFNYLGLFPQTGINILEFLCVLFAIFILLGTAVIVGFWIDVNFSEKRK